MSDTNKVIDLDVLVPQSVTVKLGEQEILINPPKMADILKLGYLGQEMRDAKDLTDTEVDTLLTKVKDYLVSIVPELGNHELNFAQIMKLTQIVSDMGMPPDAKELQEKGITANSPKKAQPA